MSYIIYKCHLYFTRYNGLANIENKFFELSMFLFTFYMSIICTYAMETSSSFNADYNNSALFRGDTDFTRAIHSMIKAVMFRDTGTVFFTENGMKITVEDYQYVQANVFVQRAMFNDYVLFGSGVDFRIKLPMFCECLNFLGSSTSGNGPRLELSYMRDGAPLRLILEECGVVTDCRIKTLRPEDYVEFDFSADKITCKVIMKPDFLRDAFLDTEFPRNSDVIEIFSCSESQHRKFRMNLLKPAVKALQLANKVSIRLDNKGFLSIQYMIDFNGETSFIEFFCAPEECSPNDEQKNPGIVMRINRLGIDYVKRQALDIFRSQMALIDWNAALKNMMLVKLPLIDARLIHLSPASKFDFSVLSPSSIRLAVTNMDMAVQLSERWNLLSFLTSNDHGASVVCYVKSLQVLLDVELYRPRNGKGIQLKTGNCIATSDSFRVNAVHAYSFERLVNSIGSAFNKLIQSTVQRRICTQVKHLIDGPFNEQLMNIANKVNLILPEMNVQSNGSLWNSKRALIEGMMLDYGLVREPYLHENAIITMHSGEISWQGNGGTPFSPNQIITSLEMNDRMLNVFISEYVINSLLYALWKKGAFNATVNKNTVPHLSQLMSSNCYLGMCLGDVASLAGVPDVSEDEEFEIFITAEKPPEMLFQDGLAKFISYNKATLHSNKHGPLFHFTGTTVGYMSLQVLDGSSIFGKLNITKVRIANHPNSVYKLGNMQLDFVSSITQTVLQQLSDDVCSNGLNLPKQNGLSLGRAQINVVGNSLKVDLDFQFDQHILEEFGIKLPEIRTADLF
ncbi:Cell cycle checkpoint protein RAD1 [Trichinella pseudospiralis]|uniref:Cell cycle checkpoint protein RAD1 n=1 Tax=Trichinella pseudospiralis TaxID=6337 RepID=A0A0V1ET96_TRIPS|nr:Cell cycle checkpoint protein RAD1 [Trichinella pseudospiralis]